MAQETKNTTVSFRDDVKAAVQVLRRGGIILYPTDTVWGLGCDATNADAVARIYELKRRAESKSMLVLMGSEAMVERYIDEPEEIAFELMREAVTPLTVIFDRAVGLAPNLLAEDGSVGVRIPDESFTSELLKAFRKPIVSTSANISGQPAASVFADISPELVQNVDYAINYRRDDRQAHKPSSIIKISKGGIFKIIRK